MPIQLFLFVIRFIMSKKLLLFVLLNSALVSTSYAQQDQRAVNEQDSLALVALYNSTNGVNWTNNEEWLSGPLSSWFGISLSVTGSGRVTGIGLSNNNLSGTIPDEIGDLTALRGLDLSSNNLYGPVPTGIGNLKGLDVLNLAWNELSGDILDEVAKLSNLVWLRLNFNKFTGSIPGTLGSIPRLEILHLGYNELTGNIPPELSNMVYLQVLSLGSNKLSGEIPPEFGDFIDLYYLDLCNNMLSGEIPIELGNLPYLEYLDLCGNQFAGEIPIGILDSFYLRRLNLSNNQFSGEIPNGIGNLTNLQFLHLSSNKLSGELPPELYDLSKLEALDLSSNSFSDFIDEGIENLSNLFWLNLSENQFTGSIPIEIGILSNLQYLDLSKNQMYGAIPDTLNNLNHIWYLDLGNNDFYSLPDLSGLENLSELYVDSLNLTFRDIIPNLKIPSRVMNYDFQYPFGDTTIIGVSLDDSISFGVQSIDFEGNEYQWVKDGIELEGEKGVSLTILEIDESDLGEYVVEVTNSDLLNLKVQSEPFIVLLDSNAVFAEGVNSEEIPANFSLSQNYPNPFNPSTNIQYTLPEASLVELTVYDMMGREVAELEKGMKSAGTYAVNFDASNLASGIYIYRLKAGGFVQTKRMLLIK